MYEMVTGRLPFEGSTSTEVLASVLSNKEPQPLARYSRDAPIELERIVSKTLRKDREQRYQMTKDLLLDLQSLKQQLDFDARLERSLPPQTGDWLGTTSETAPTVSVQPPVTASINHSTANLIKQNGRILAILLAIAIIAISTLTYFFYSARSTVAIDSIAVLPNH
jgi:serine/threonine protein kinase